MDIRCEIGIECNEAVGGGVAVQRRGQGHALAIVEWAVSGQWMGGLGLVEVAKGTQSVFQIDDNVENAIMP